MAKGNIEIVLSNGKQAGNTINELRQQANRLSREIKDLSPGSDKFVQKTKDFQKVTGRLKDIRKEVKGVETTMQKAGGFLKKFGTQIAAAFSIGVVIRGLKDAFNTIKGFQQANANLASVLGKVRSEIGALTEDAKRLGAQTSKSAAEVTGLQTEFAKLGFTEREILNVTEATLKLAEATGTELGEAAAVTGATLRAFGMDTSQTQRVVDVMAKSFSSSSLDMEKFKTAMAAVAPVAKTAGLNIEQTTSYLGLLADRGLDASTAGTSLRNIFLKLSEKGMTLEEAMGKINTSVDKNATALALFGTRGATSAVIMAENSVAAGELEAKLNDAAGAAGDMAAEQLNTLDGKIKILQSTWEGFILSLDSGDGVMSNSVKGSIEFITNAIAGLATLDTRFEMMFNNIDDLSKHAKKQILDLGITEAGNQVKEVIDTAFEGLTNQQIIADFGKSKQMFIDALVEEGESIEDATSLFRVYYREKLGAYQVDVKAQQDAFDAAQKARDTALAIEESRNQASRDRETEKKRKERERELKEKAALLKLARDQEEQALRNLQDLRIQLMEEGLNREIEKLWLDTDRKIEALVGTEEQITEQRLYLEKIRLEKLKDMRDAFRDEEDKKKDESIKKERERQAQSVQTAISSASSTAGVLGGIFGNLAGLQEEGSEKYKTFAQVQARMAAFQAAINAYQSTAAIPIVGPALAPIAAATALAFGMKQASMIGQQNPGTPSGGATGGGGFGTSFNASASAGGVPTSTTTAPPANPLQTTTTRTQTEPSAPAPQASGSSDKFDVLIDELRNWPTKLKVINSVQETNEGIKTLNTLEDDSSF